MKTLKKGSKGAIVRTLQEKLTAAGFTISPTTEYFGSKTDRAVRNFQRKKKLIADGKVGPLTWSVLNGSSDTKPKVNPVMSLEGLVASLGLGLTGSGFAAQSCLAPNSIEIAKPVSQLSMSENGLKFLYTREAMKNVSNYLHWPKGSSGVTLGPGYDMKERSEAEITRDLKNIGVSETAAKKVAKASGLSGLAAKTFCKTNRKVVKLTNKEEFKLMRMIVPKYERAARAKIKVHLLQQEFDAIVSWCYNFGSLWNTIANFINKGQIKAAMNRWKQGNKSKGKVMDGLIKRRALEIAIFTLGKYGKFKVV